MTFWLAIIVTVVVLYFVSSGISYVAMYRIGAKFPSRVAGTLFAPLEWLARRVVPFRSLYNGYLAWCYKRFAAGRDYNTRAILAEHVPRKGGNGDLNGPSDR